MLTLEKQQFIEEYLVDPDKHKNSPYLKDAGVINALINPPGPVQFSTSVLDHVTNYCILGATDPDLAKFFKVPMWCIDVWKTKHAGFAEAIENGRGVADAKVGKALFQRSVGYSHPAVDIRVVGGMIVETEYTKQYPPDTQALKLYLTNRDPEHWRDKTEVEVTEVLTPLERKEKIRQYQERLNNHESITH